MILRRTLLTAATTAALVVAPVASARAGAAAVDRPVVRVTSMTGAAEVPGPGDPDGRGLAGVLLKPATDTVCWVIVVRGITLPATAAHIHPGAAGQAGPPLVTLTAPNERGVSFGCTESPHVDAIAANPSAYYVNVHNSDHPAGALRGQLY